MNIKVRDARKWFAWLRWLENKPISGQELEHRRQVWNAWRTHLMWRVKR